ncbi:hypothetical protein [Nostoc foliaceum]|uniref:Uncharacterized protein n=2 Tax=Nostoc TaxID=1177 RepID=A0ABR8IIY9_9NOSO|nr:hypothetical protein [Nostoc foliaceum]MBD2565675.1 hypothetical protein [Nostoc linckia FACHB-391]MBD2651545.1 hypothetical protein [Nostoc foliaceum FACHB-393]
MKAPSTRLRYDSLSAHTDQTRFLEGEAGNRAQTDTCCEVTLALMGSFYGETEPRKATYSQAGRNTKPPTLLKLTPAAFLLEIAARV